MTERTVDTILTWILNHATERACQRAQSHRAIARTRQHADTHRADARRWFNDGHDIDHIIDAIAARLNGDTHARPRAQRNHRRRPGLVEQGPSPTNRKNQP